MTLPLFLESLSVRGFRNLTQIELEFVPRVNVISGANGHGKTSVLEALYFVATSRSFRTEKVSELRQQGSEATRVEATFREGGQLRRQIAASAGNVRSFAIDGKKPTRLSAYATRTPLVVFHPGDLALVHGSASVRRTLLDRVALYVDPPSSDARASYARAQRERQVILEKRGLHAPELDAFERVLAEHATRVRSARQRAYEALRAALLRSFASMAARDLELAVSLAADSWGTEDAFAAELRQRRDRDRQRRAATFGPQRDDLVLEINGRGARRLASQGQQRVLTLALKIAELECIRAARGAQPILLLDDVSSELDPERTGAVYDFVRQADSQVLVTTTRPELFETPGLSGSERRDIRLDTGSVAAW